MPFLEEQSSLTVTGTKLASSCQDTVPLWQIRHVPTRCGTNSSHVILECPHSQLFKFRLWAVFPKEKEQRKSLFFSDIELVSLLVYHVTIVYTCQQTLQHKLLNTVTVVKWKNTTPIIRFRFSLPPYF